MPSSRGLRPRARVDSGDRASPGSTTALGQAASEPTKAIATGIIRPAVSAGAAKPTLRQASAYDSGPNGAVPNASHGASERGEARRAGARQRVTPRPAAKAEREAGGEGADEAGADRVREREGRRRQSRDRQRATFGLGHHLRPGKADQPGAEADERAEAELDAERPRRPAGSRGRAPRRPPVRSRALCGRPRAGRPPQRKVATAMTAISRSCGRLRPAGGRPGARRHPPAASITGERSASAFGTSP